MPWCTSGVGLQVLPFVGSRHLGEHLSFPAIIVSKLVSSDNVCGYTSYDDILVFS